MASAQVALATLTLGAPKATVTFSGISGAYRDLRLVITYTGTIVRAGYRCNADTGANYNYIIAHGSGSATGSLDSGVGDTSGRLMGNWACSATVPTNTILDIFDYSATDKHKSGLAREDSPSFGTSMGSHRWASTSAVTSITLFDSNAGNSFSAGSTFTLYGVSA
jgi:hypothetical protein